MRIASIYYNKNLSGISSVPIKVMVPMAFPDFINFLDLRSTPNVTLACLVMVELPLVRPTNAREPRLSLGQST